MAETPAEKRKPGRPKGEPTATIATRLTLDMVHRLQDWADAAGMNKAAAISLAVARLLQTAPEDADG